MFIEGGGDRKREAAKLLGSRDPRAPLGHSKVQRERVDFWVGHGLKQRPGVLPEQLTPSLRCQLYFLNEFKASWTVCVLCSGACRGLSVFVSERKNNLSQFLQGGSFHDCHSENNVERLQVICYLILSSDRDAILEMFSLGFR